jgi:hypothetical protein
MGCPCSGDLPRALALQAQVLLLNTRAIAAAGAPQHHARDLGLFIGANTAPMVLARALAWLCVTKLGGQTTLFLVCCLLIVVSNFTLLRSDQLTFRCQHGHD